MPMELKIPAVGESIAEVHIALTSYDHRFADGREAVLLLKRIKQAVETSARMLIEV